MLRNNHIPIINLRLQTFIDLDTPSALCKSGALGLVFLQMGGVLPAAEEARLELLVEAVVDGDVVGARGIDKFFQVHEGILLGERLGDEAIELALGVEEVVVGIGDDDGGVVG